MMPGRGNTQDAFLPAEISHVQTSLLKRKKKKKLLNSFCSRSFRCSDRPSLHQEDSKSEREKLFLVNWRRRRSGGGARHLGKFSGEACHSSHHHFSPSTTATSSSSSSSVALNSSAVSLLGFHKPDPSTVKKKEKKEKRKKKRRLPGHAEMRKESSHILAITWMEGGGMRPRRSLHWQRAKTSCQKANASFGKLPCLVCVTGTVMSDEQRCSKGLWVLREKNVPKSTQRSHLRDTCTTECT